MTAYLLGIGTAFWLGLLTSLSPCPLATNIAALSFVSRDVGNARRVLWNGLRYTLGRMLAYVGLGILLVNSMLSAPRLSQWLQKDMNLYLGPLLLVVGMVLLDLIRLPSFPGRGLAAWREGLAKRDGNTILLGALFALSFCPVSAALFFGSLLPLALQFHSGILFPASYGIATAIPVLVFAILLASGMHRLTRNFQRLQHMEIWARRATGIIFLLVGIDYCLVHIFGVA